MQDYKKLIDAVDALLPQTQCKLCKYDGCRPYAEAIVTRNEEINRCLPGGVTTLKLLGDLLQKDITTDLAAMEQNTKAPSVAVIRESECIGCTKCIQACPVDAIIGAGKLMHTVLIDACTGCELCIPPCPVDCIDIISTAEKSDSEKLNWQNQSRNRYQARQARLQADQQIKNTFIAKKDLEQRKKLIAEAVARVKKK